MPNITLTIGSKAPDFSLKDQEGNPHTLKDYRGTWVLLYFYPKDMTPGCTTEACSLRDAFTAYKRAGIFILGVSADTSEKHKKFAKKYSLPFPLLADTDKKVITTYNAWGKKSFLGKTFLGIKRVSYLIDPKGNIAKIYPNVSPEAHAQEVLKDVKLLP